MSPLLLSQVPSENFSLHPLQFLASSLFPVPRRNFPPRAKRMKMSLEYLLQSQSDWEFPPPGIKPEQKYLSDRGIGDALSGIS